MERLAGSLDRPDRVLALGGRRLAEPLHWSWLERPTCQEMAGDHARRIALAMEGGWVREQALRFALERSSRTSRRGGEDPASLAAVESSP